MLFRSFDHTFKTSFRTNGGETPGSYSEMIPVTLTQGILKSVPLLFNSAKGLDIVSPRAVSSRFAG